MRIYGRTPIDEFGARQWIEVDTDENGANDNVYLVWLAQAFKLNWGESPFYGDWGIPAVASVVQQIAPDFFVNLTQKRFSKYFASLIVSKLQIQGQPQTPTYRVNVLFNSGVKFSFAVGNVYLIDGFGNRVLDGFGNPILLYKTNNTIPVT